MTTLLSNTVLFDLVPVADMVTALCVKADLSLTDVINTLGVNSQISETKIKELKSLISKPVQATPMCRKLFELLGMMINVKYDRNAVMSETKNLASKGALKESTSSIVNRIRATMPKTVATVHAPIDNAPIDNAPIDNAPTSEPTVNDLVIECGLVSVQAMLSRLMLGMVSKDECLADFAAMLATINTPCDLVASLENTNIQKAA